MPALKYSNQECIETAKKFTTKEGLYRSHPSIYRAINRRGLEREAFSHLSFKRRGRWSDQEIYEKSKQFSSIKEWRERDRRSYEAAQRNKVLKKLRANKLRRNMKDGNFWSNNTDKIFEIAKKYSCKKDLIYNDNAVYQAAKSLGILEKACAHMERLGNNHKRLIYKIFFKNSNSVYVGLTFNLKVRISQHRRHGRFKDLFKNEEYVVETDGVYLDQISAAEKEKQVVEYFKKTKINLLNVAPPGGLGGRGSQ